MVDFDSHIEERTKAVLEGYHRDFNKLSIRAWGTRDSPAPVLGLEEGGECEGVAFRISEENIDEVIEKLDKREGKSYKKHRKEVHLEDGRTRTATVWINDPDRWTYAGDESLEERLRMAENASGEVGTAKEYALSVWQELQDLGIQDSHVEEYVERLQNLSN